MKTILLLEDHDDTREMLRGILQEAYPDGQVDMATTLHQANQLVNRLNYNLAVIDINLPDGSGLELLDRIRGEDIDTYVVIMSIFDDDRHIEDALRRGAHGYLLKDQPRASIRDAFRNIAIGVPALAPAVARRLILRYRSDSPMPQSEPDPALATLSPRELEVLTLIAKGLGRGEISKLLNITQNTVSGYVKSIYRKLDINCRAEAVLIAVKNNLVC